MSGFRRALWYVRKTYGGMFMVAVNGCDDAEMLLLLLLTVGK